MTISDNSQLGIRFVGGDREVKLRAINCLQSVMESREKTIRDDISFLEDKIESGASLDDEFEYEYMLKTNGDGWKQREVDEVDFGEIDQMFCFGDKKWGIKWFLIQESVFRAAELIKIGDNFDCFMLRKIKTGDYVYLLGKTRMLKFIVVEGGIKGIWWDDKENKIFEWAVNFQKNKYFYYGGFDKEFSQIMQLLTFVELGDIEVTVLGSCKHNGAKTKSEKIYNGSPNTVYVVDSSWNKLIIRTEGFAVRGHFRLQPYGEGMRDRKLLWINAFEKNGYTRKPKASIIRSDI